jgi:hypothetical protein
MNRVIRELLGSKNYRLEYVAALARNPLTNARGGEAGLDAVVIDLDPQASAAPWGDDRGTRAASMVHDPERGALADDDRRRRWSRPQSQARSLANAPADQMSSPYAPSEADWKQHDQHARRRPAAGRAGQALVAPTRRLVPTGALPQRACRR